jgi:hypothetical protein
MAIEMCTAIPGPLIQSSLCDSRCSPLRRIEKRSKYSRRRGAKQEEDVDYINDRNMRFNKKAARFYDEFTAEIKQNLERGTAV